MKKLFFVLLCFVVIFGLNAQKKDFVSNLEYSPTYTANGSYNSATDDMWDILSTFNASAAASPGTETDGVNIYTTTWNAGSFSRYDMDGTLLGDFTVAGASNIRDMAYDGTYFYGSAASMSIFIMDLANETLIGTIPVTCAGVTGVRHIAYDPGLDGGNGGFWVGNWAELGAIAMDGSEIYGNMANPGDLYGSAYDEWTDGGPYLWLFSQGGSGAVLHQFDIAAQAATGVTHDATELPGFLAGSIAGGLATYVNDSGLFVMLTNIQQDPNLVGVYEIAVTADPTAPAAPTGVTLTPDAGGALSAVIDWICPDMQVNGDPLTDLDEMKVYRDGVLIYTDTTPTIGAAGTYTDPAVPASGTYTYAVGGFNDAGEGIAVSVSAWVGEDVPAEVTGLLLEDYSTDTDLLAYLSWMNPVVGLNGGPFNQPILGYHVERSDGAVFELTGSLIEWTDDTITVIDYYSYSITAYNSIGDGATTVSNTSLITTANVMFADDFSGGMANWTVVNNGGAADWMIFDEPYPNTYTMPVNSLPPVMSADADEAGSGSTIDSELILAVPLDCSAMIDVILDFDSDFYALGTDDYCYVDVSVNGGTDWTNVLTYAGVSVRDTHEMLNISQDVAGFADVLIRFHSIQPGWDWWWTIDNVMISGTEGSLGAITGTVTDAVTTNPIDGAIVTFNGVTQTTDATGYYEYATAYPGTYMLACIADGYYASEEESIVLSGQTTVTDFALDPHLLGILDGTVTDADSGDPLVGAEINAISMAGYEFDVVTDPDGYYSISDVVVETYNVSCTFPDYPTEMVEDVLIEEGITTTIDFELEGYTFWNDFETNDGGLLSDNAGGWQWGAFTSGPMAGYSGANGWGTIIGDDYVVSSNFALDTPVQYMISSPVAMLEFWHWYDIEASFDGGNVKISTDGGASWSVITPLTGYTGTANTSNPLTGEEIFCGHDQGFWELAQFDLSSYMGQSVMFRWHFGSDTSVQYPGWYIDDVSISGGVMPDPGWIEGIVTLTGAGPGNVEDVVIMAGYASTSPASNGDYSIEIIPETYNVTATLAGYESVTIEDVVVVEGVIIDDIDFELAWIPPYFAPPENLAVDEDTGMFTWDPPPGGGAGEILHHSGYDNNGVGTNGVVDFISCARFDDVELLNYYGSDLTAVNVIIHSADYSAVSIQVYEGGSYGDPGTLVYDEDVTGSVIVGDWTNHVLSTPVPLVAGNEYWIGYAISATGDHPAAVDAGPMIDDKGAWMYYNSAWDVLPNISSTLNYNWVITGVIGSDGDQISLSKRSTPEKAVNQQRSISAISDGNFEAEFNRKIRSAVRNIEDTTRELQSYNVFLDDMVNPVGNTMETFWEFNGLVQGQDYVAGVQAVYDDGVSEIEELSFTSNITDANDILPLKTELTGNYPNPFNPETVIMFSLNEQSPVALDIYNVKGQLVKTLVNETLEADNYQILWNGLDSSSKPVSSGVYFYKMRTNNYTACRKMILVK